MKPAHNKVLVYADELTPFMISLLDKHTIICVVQ